MAYSPYSYESKDSTYKVPTKVTKNEEFKGPSVSEKEDKASFLPMNDYYRKPSVLKDNYKKVSLIPEQEYKMSSVPKPKPEYNVSSLYKNSSKCNYGEIIIYITSYNKVLSVSKDNNYSI